ncbi:Hamartin protein-domain-containing protein [Cokeromyces recurvatus]|uniref:Hamartin protein-domain-containing protein n=1 Tax=Cokeromyces recurvatus TaxID=90255 RepID=UPI00221FB47A|nr:Hamartin protein-domain-containing protein [Cokeromyces recurvatus]KAI7907153.1 Hamartin protein-domain-containing protein [Cokeromyces recurvatus]
MVTLRDIIRAITQAVRTATSDSEGQSALDIIEQYIDEQSSANIGTAATPLTIIDSTAIDKLSQELITLYENTINTDGSATIISSRPEIKRIQAQHFILLRSLRALLPLLRPTRLFEDWWKLLKPILSMSSFTNQIKKETRLIVSDALILEQELVRMKEVGDCVYFHRLVSMYLEWTEKKKEEMLERDETSKQHQALLDLEQDEWSKNLMTILLSVGASETKKFFFLLNGYFLSSKYRLQIVYLLSEFMRRRRTHLHEILDTPLFYSMLKSLMYDNSTTLIAISVTNLIMLLPRMCTSLPQFLPQLFYIFARAICWDQLRDMRKKQSTDSFSYNNLPPTRTIEDGWDCVDYTFSKLSAPPSNPQTGAFFTSLYGLYPCNFLKFLHRPYAYFKENDFKLPEEFDEETFKSRTIPQVKRHMLHPNLVVMDAQTELTDKTRWMKMEPPDVIAQIMGLDLTNAASRVAFYEEDQQQEQPDLLDESLWNNTSKLDDKLELKQDENQPSLMSNIVLLHKALKSGAEVLVGDDIWNAGLEPTKTTTTCLHSNPVANDEMESETRLLVAALKREVLLLRNELNFELFLKQQHLQHIGRLHRERVLDTSVEAERQQLYNTTRMLKAQLNQTTSALTKLKAETALTKQKHIKWEDEQSNKLRSYREQRKEWQNQMARVEHQVLDYKKQLSEQKIELERACQRIFELENELKTLEPTLKQVTENEHRVKQLTQQMLLWEEDTSRMEEQKSYIKGLLSQWWSMEELVVSLQTENRRLQEEHIRKDEYLEKLKVQCTNYQTKIDSFNTTFSKESETNETERLRNILNEIKSKYEQLEMEKLEWNAQIEALKYKANQQAELTLQAE